MIEYIPNKALRAVQAHLREHGLITLSDKYDIAHRSGCHVDDIEGAIEAVNEMQATLQVQNPRTGKWSRIRPPGR